LLLDDVLSAVDMHTTRRVVDKCLADSLLEGRTVMLVKYVAMTSSLAANVVEIASDGTIGYRTGVAEALSRLSKLLNGLKPQKRTLGSSMS